MTDAYINRGPMVADSDPAAKAVPFARSVTEDPNLAAKTVGVLGHLLTYRDGERVNPEIISGFMKDGVSAVKGALRQLEGQGYLARIQQRSSAGTFGPTVYFVTDEPARVDLRAWALENELDSEFAIDPRDTPPPPAILPAPTPTAVYVVVNNKLGAVKVGITRESNRRSRLRSHQRHGWTLHGARTFGDFDSALKCEQSVLSTFRSKFGEAPFYTPVQLPQGGWTEAFPLAKVNPEQAWKEVNKE